jgi:protein-tyrosine phosphatase
VNVSSQVLEWDGCGNVRDLGGHPIERGGTTRFGVVIRADNVRRLTPAGWEALLAHGVRRVVDLRWHEELAEDPPNDVPVEVVHVPIFGMHRLETRYARFAEFARASADGPDFIRRLYGSYLDEHPRAFAEAVAAVATTDGPVVVHCTRGKDRTGLVAALILRIAGVGIDEIAADYGLTPDTESDRDTPPSSMSDEDRARRFLLSAPPQGMAQALRELDARHGSAAAYLKLGGLDRSVIGDLRDRLVGSSVLGEPSKDPCRG